MLDKIDDRQGATYEKVIDVLWDEFEVTRAQMKEAFKELKCAKRKVRMAIALHEAANVPIKKIELMIANKQTNRS